DTLAAALCTRYLPGVLEAGVRIRVPIVACAVPEAVVELDVELRVRAQWQLLDRRHLQGLEACLRVIHRTQQRERKREHDMVGSDGLCPDVLAEGERVGAGGQLDRGQRRWQRDLTRERVREPCRELVVPTSN